jgi:ABC-type oligopeptide transport system ATPase subunit
VGESIAEPIRTHRLLAGREAIAMRVAELLGAVALPADAGRRHPHAFSGGQRQRICIARALACDPAMIIADESVSALDVSIRSQILDLLVRLQNERNLALLFISHDMAVVERISHRVAVMYLGQIVEIGPTAAVLGTPQHPYTRRLLAAVPVPDPIQAVRRPVLVGEIGSSVRPVGDAPPPLTYSKVGADHLVAAELHASLAA